LQRIDQRRAQHGLGSLHQNVHADSGCRGNYRYCDTDPHQPPAQTASAPHRLHRHSISGFHSGVFHYLVPQIVLAPHDAIE
jgi:hypothetical protein